MKVNLTVALNQRVDRVTEGNIVIGVDVAKERHVDRQRTLGGGFSIDTLSDLTTQKVDSNSYCGPYTSYKGNMVWMNDCRDKLHGTLLFSISQTGWWNEKYRWYW